MLSDDQDRKEIERFQYFLRPGYIFLSHEPALIYTVMGSAVTVSLWDRKNHFGGLSHFLYPKVSKLKKPTTRYGNVALPTLIKLMIADGSEKSGLEAQIFGGGDLLSPSERSMGSQNVSMARMILIRQGIPITSEDVGGSKGRKLVFKSDTNEVMVLKVDQLRKEDWYPYVLGDTR
jgi:chemotaxis protein CheD